MADVSLPGSRTDVDSPSLTLRKTYRPPALEDLGRWQAVTLQQSIPIFPIFRG